METRAEALKNNNIDDIFDDGTTDNTAASGTDAKTEGLKEEVKPEVTPPTPSKTAASELTDALHKLRESITPPAKEEPKAPELTQAQIDEALGNITVSPEDLAALNDPEKQGATLKKLLSAAGLHGLKMSKVLLDAQVAPLQAQLNELIQERQVRISQDLERKFYEDYPTLASDAHKQIVALVGKDLASNEAYRKLNFAERAKLLAEKTAEHIKSVVPTFVLKPSGTPAAKTKTTTIPRQAVGATSGTGGGATEQAEQPHPSDANISTGVDIFD